ncbi:MAG TPA: ATP synthase F0 subunit C [Gemmataceae bacterium]|nr:ATP synthase F0 subunit C [Gemmataceae bacterium]
MKMMKPAALAAIGVLLLAASQAFAQGPAPVETSYTLSGSGMAAGLGMGLTIIGAGIGFGRIGAAALESMARQPEVGGRVFTAMLIIAAMLEGATLASVVFLLVIGMAKASF